MRNFIIGLFLVLTCIPSHAQTIVEQLKPGMGYSQLKQWAIENQYVFENYTKDSIIIRDAAMGDEHSLRVQARFCGGDDYAGRASIITIQQQVGPITEAIKAQRAYVESIAGPFDAAGKLPQPVTLRKSASDANDGLSIVSGDDGGGWEIGLFTTKSAQILLLQTILKKDSVCN